MNLNITPQQLRRAADLKERIDALQVELADLLGAPSHPEVVATPTKKRRMSRAGRARIAAAARARWARLRQDGLGHSARMPKRRMTPALRARLAAIARERWRKVRAQGKKAL